jgi:protein kinase-like protein
MPASSEVGTVAMTGGSGAKLKRTSAPEPERFAPGTILAQRYRIAGRIGRGGMGEVYRAYDLILEQDVALKFLPAGFASNASALDRFRNEVRLARQVSHPNVCRVYDIGEIEDAPFLTMEYVDGEDLASLLRRIGRLPPDKALDIARRLCAGLAAAHEKGVLHRDLKPANIMVDGRGEVLITDFGLAAAAGTVDATAARQGTPAYQAPEQLAGREVTPRSDLYALGLVLYEVFTGKRAFEAKSMEDLVRMQQEATPASVTSLARDVDPAVDRAILRCLAADPRRRPASAKAVAASLPGADPLAAAIAAGETPSPEMVAQAGEHEGFRPAIGLALLAATIVGLIASAALQTNGTFPARTPFENSPEALETMSRQLVQSLGYSQRPGDTAFGMETSSDYLRYAESHFRPDRIFQQVAGARPAPVTFWYRQSPLPMNPRDLGFVYREYPGFSVSGMLRLRLDMEGRLLEFEARPLEHATGAAVPMDWKPLFAAAKLDPAAFQPSAPEWVPAMAFDTNAAWTGTFPETPEIPIRIEAAAWRGKPVSFRIIGPWTHAVSDVSASQFPVEGLFWSVVPYFVLFPLGVFLAWRNVRLKRGDVSGALRLSVTAFLLDFGGAAIGMHYFWAPVLPWRVLSIMAVDMAQCAFLGVAYLALEPYVRRRYPGMLISWARLLHNGPRDPLVGSHILLGCAAGILLGIPFMVANALMARSGRGLEPFFFVRLTLNGPRYFLGSLCDAPWNAAFDSMVILFLFFVLRTILKHGWLAAAALTGLFTTIAFLDSSAPLFDVPPLVFAVAAGMFLLIRFGLPSLVTILITAKWVGNLPLTVDPSRWYFSYSLVAMLLVAGLAAYSFRASLAGRRLLSDESLN